ncbi:MAG: DUF5688 family protein [Eubacteriales bacterium]|nr:DUF5688 family protein [Eubacteriales bacterium]
MTNIYEEKEALEIGEQLREKLRCKDYLEGNLYIGLRRSRNNIKAGCDSSNRAPENGFNSVTRVTEFEGIEAYLYVRDSIDSARVSVEISREYLTTMNISEQEVWSMAEKNTFAETIIKPISVVLAEALGVFAPAEPDGDDIPLYVVSNPGGYRGAASILNTEALREFGESRKIRRWFVIPSSVNEMLIYPFSEEQSIDKLSAMVCEVNETEVLPVEQLADRAYVWDCDCCRLLEYEEIRV